MDLWNNKHLPVPPINTYKVIDKNIDIKYWSKVFGEGKKFFDNENYMSAEYAVLSIIVYRSKQKFRSAKDFKALEKVYKALNSYFNSNISFDLKSFIDLIPSRYTNETYLPNKNILHYILVRLQGLVKVLERVVETCKITAYLFDRRMHTGHFWKIGFIIFSLVSRIYILAKYSAKFICEFYNKILPFSRQLKNNGRDWLPENYILPTDLQQWMNVDWLDIDDELQVIETPELPNIMQYIDLVDDDDIEFCDEYIMVDDNEDDIEVVNEFKNLGNVNIKQNIQALRGFDDGEDVGELLDVTEEVSDSGLLDENLLVQVNYESNKTNNFSSVSENLPQTKVRENKNSGIDKVIEIDDSLHLPYQKLSMEEINKNKSSNIHINLPHTYGGKNSFGEVIDINKSLNIPIGKTCIQKSNDDVDIINISNNDEVDEVIEINDSLHMQDKHAFIENTFERNNNEITILDNSSLSYLKENGNDIGEVIELSNCSESSETPCRSKFFHNTSQSSVTILDSSLESDSDEIKNNTSSLPLLVPQTDKILNTTDFISLDTDVVIIPNTPESRKRGKKKEKTNRKKKLNKISSMINAPIKSTKNTNQLSKESSNNSTSCKSNFSNKLYDHNSGLISKANRNKLREGDSENIISISDTSIVCEDVKTKLVRRKKKFKTKKSSDASHIRDEKLKMTKNTSRELAVSGFELNKNKANINKFGNQMHSKTTLEINGKRKTKKTGSKNNDNKVLEKDLNQIGYKYRQSRKRKWEGVAENLHEKIKKIKNLHSEESLPIKMKHKKKKKLVKNGQSHIQQNVQQTNNLSNINKKKTSSSSEVIKKESRRNKILDGIIVKDKNIHIKSKNVNSSDKKGQTINLIEKGNTKSFDEAQKDNNKVKFKKKKLKLLNNTAHATQKNWVHNKNDLKINNSKRQKKSRNKKKK